MVLKTAFVGETGEDSALHNYCSGLLGGRVCQVGLIVLLRRWSEKAVGQRHLRKTAHSVFRFLSRQSSVSVKFYWEDGLEKSLCH